MSGYGAAAADRMRSDTAHPTGRPRARCANYRHLKPSGQGAGHVCGAQDGRPWVLVSWPACDLWAGREVAP